MTQLHEKLMPLEVQKWVLHNAAEFSSTLQCSPENASMLKYRLIYACFFSNKLIRTRLCKCEERYYLFTVFLYAKCWILGFLFCYNWQYM